LEPGNGHPRLGKKDNQLGGDMRVVFSYFLRCWVLYTLFATILLMLGLLLVSGSIFLLGSTNGQALVLAQFFFVFASVGSVAGFLLLYRFRKSEFYMLRAYGMQLHQFMLLVGGMALLLCVPLGLVFLSWSMKGLE
jgi:hypothetical protein